MEYYIEPAEQTDEVKAQLAAITPSTLNPEDLTLHRPGLWLRAHSGGSL
jgi:hypothetical protein